MHFEKEFEYHKIPEYYDRYFDYAVVAKCTRGLQKGLARAGLEDEARRPAITSSLTRRPFGRTRPTLSPGGDPREPLNSGSDHGDPSSHPAATERSVLQLVKSVGYTKFAEAQVRRLNFDALRINEPGREERSAAQERPRDQAAEAQPKTKDT